MEKAKYRVIQPRGWSYYCIQKKLFGLFWNTLTCTDKNLAARVLCSKQEVLKVIDHVIPIFGTTLRFGSILDAEFFIGNLAIRHLEPEIKIIKTYDKSGKAIQDAIKHT